MKLKIFFLQMLCMFFAVTCQASVDILCYHELDNNPPDGKDTWSVSSSNFEKHLQYFQSNGYKLVNFAEYKAYCEGKLELPEKSVMITFDDGYESFYTKAYPLLQKYHAPAMLAVISSWVENTPPAGVRKNMTWEQLREVEQSGLVKVVSHTDSAHVMRPANPLGSVGSVIENKLYLGNRYETDAEYAQRLNNEFSYVQKLFVEKLGHKADGMVWPYGRYSGKAVELALQNGFEATFLLNGGTNEPVMEDFRRAKRMIVYNNPDVSDLLKTMAIKDSVMGRVVVAQVDIDKIYDVDKKVLDSNIEALTSRLFFNNVNIVVLQAFSDEDADGNVEQVYFNNSVVPVKADVFGYISNMLSQNGYRVFAWMPTLAVQTLAEADGSNLVQASDVSKAGWYRRVSPFDEKAMAKLQKLYRELGQNTYIDGVLLQDDLYLNDFEDVSAPAQAAKQKRLGVAEVSSAAWSKMKTEQLNAVAASLFAEVRKNRPGVYTARNIYTAVVQDAESETWFGQNYKDYLRDYDYTFLMAYDRMEGVDNTTEFLQKLLQAAKAEDADLSKTVFKLQTYDWEKKKWIPAAHLKNEVKILRQNGVKHIGYYPDTYYRFNASK